MDGHFFTYCRSPVDRKWYWYNDAMVSKINDPIQENRGIPYLLFFQKIKKLFSLGIKLTVDYFYIWHINRV